MPGRAWIDETTAAFERHVAAERGLSPHTVRGYVSDARSLLEHAAQCGASGPGELTAPVLRSWLAGQRKNPPQDLTTSPRAKAPGVQVPRLAGALGFDAGQHLGELVALEYDGLPVHVRPPARRPSWVP